jgi:hypothetical protein
LCEQNVEEPSAADEAAQLLQRLRQVLLEARRRELSLHELYALLALRPTVHLVELVSMFCASKTHCCRYRKTTRETSLHIVCRLGHVKQLERTCSSPLSIFHLCVAGTQIPALLVLVDDELVALEDQEAMVAAEDKKKQRPPTRAVEVNLCHSSCFGVMSLGLAFLQVAKTRWPHSTYNFGAQSSSEDVVAVLLDGLQGMEQRVKDAAIIDMLYVAVPSAC